MLEQVRCLKILNILQVSFIHAYISCTHVVLTHICTCPNRCKYRHTLKYIHRKKDIVSQREERSWQGAWYWTQYRDMKKKVSSIPHILYSLPHNFPLPLHCLPSYYPRCLITYFFLPCVLPPSLPHTTAYTSFFPLTLGGYVIAFLYLFVSLYFSVFVSRIVLEAVWIFQNYFTKGVT